jgi:hypothetical protein
MKNLQKLYTRLKKNLPKPIVTKLNNIGKERGVGGMYTSRNSVFGLVLMEEVTFIEKFQSEWERLQIYEKGFRIIVSPQKYFTTNFYHGFEDKIIVRYRYHSEIEKYPYDEKNITVKENGDIKGFVVVDISDLDSVNGKSSYIGAEAIGRPDMEYATNEEVQKIRFCNLYIVGKIINKDQYLNSDTIKLLNEYCEMFELTDLYIKNEILIKLTKNGSVCPDLNSHLDFLDLVDGKQKSDVGRDKWMITTTKINLHHIRKRTPGELNHNHKNVFFGTAKGNTLDIVMPPSDPETLKLSVKRLINHYTIEKIYSELEKYNKQMI